MSVCDDIGINIKTMRKVRGLSREQLAAKIQECGAEQAVSPITIGAWERGERRPLACNLYWLSVAMDCSVEYFYYGRESKGIRVRDRQRQTVDYIFSKWDGDVHALLEWVRMYAAMDRADRVDVAGLAINQFKHRLHEGMQPGIDVDLKWLEQECDRICHDR